MLEDQPLDPAIHDLQGFECGVPALDEEAARKKFPRYPVPCSCMGRLACRTDQRSLGLGKLPLGCTVDRCLKARQQVAACVLVVDAKDDRAKYFYLRFGFKTLQDAPLTLYLPLGR